MRLIIFVLLALISFVTPSKAVDLVALTTNFIVGWQDVDGGGDASCSQSGNHITCGGGFSGPSHAWYVKAMSSAYAQSHWQYLKIMYFTFQDNNESGKQIASAANDTEMRLAIKHMISCYRPVFHGGRIADGAVPDWHEAKDVGLNICEPLGQ
jgi:hypothetical protein